MLPVKHMVYFKVQYSEDTHIDDASHSTGHNFWQPIPFE